MQEHSYTLQLCSISQASDVPSSVANTSTDYQSSSSNMPNNIKSRIEPSTSTPELNLLLDKLTEILRFRSGYRRHFGIIQHCKDTSLSPSSSMINFTRLQSNSLEPLDNTPDVCSTKLNGSSMSTAAWKSTNTYCRTLFSNRSPHHHHHHHHHHRHHHHHHHHHHRHQYHANLPKKTNNFEGKRRLPSLLQRLIDEGNLIKEAVYRLKSQRFSQTFKLQQQQEQKLTHTPSTPTIKISNQTLSILTSRSTPSSSVNINIPQQLSNSSTQIISSPNRGISWLLSSSVFGMTTTSTTNCSSGNGSPLHTCCFSSTQDRTPMVIGIQDR